MEQEKQIYNQYNFQPDPQFFKDCYTYGAATGRFNSILYIEHLKQYLIPQGVNLSLHSVENNQIKRIKSFRYNQDAIFVCLQNSKYIFSIGFSGQVIIIDKFTFEQVKQFKTKGREVRFATVNEENIVLNSEYDPSNPNKQGLIEVFEINSCIKIFEQEGNYKYSLLYGKDLIISILRNPVQNSQNQNLKHDNYITCHQLQVKNPLIQQIHLPHIDEIIYAGQNQNYGVFLYTSRKLLILDLENTQNYYLGDIEGSGAILTGNIQDDNFYCVPKNNQLMQIYLNKNVFQNLPKNLTLQQKSSSEYKIQEIKSLAISQRNYFLNFQNQNKEFFTFNEDGLTLYSLEQKKQLANIMHSSVTCVGLASNNENSLTAVGDICGNLFVYDTSKYDINNQILYQAWLPSSIRCLSWSICGKYIFAGCMDGTIQKWDFKNSAEIILVKQLEDSTITSIKSNQKNNDYLITTTSGNLYIYSDLSQENPQQKLKFLGHLPVPKEKNPNPDRFGSLHIKAEIWNSCWIENHNKIATSSEDQTGHIYSFENQYQNIKTEHVLSGQTLAVTGIDCQEMKNNLGTIYAQCSDDRTIKIYDANNNFQLLMILSTHFIPEWHTLTYLALEKNGTRIAISGQSGYLFIFDLEKKQWVYGEKTHLGGIEGLIWQNGQLVTCSSDCCINVYKL